MMPAEMYLFYGMNTSQNLYHGCTIARGALDYV